ncbi:hypothetical protein Hdeb2414_s0001g00023461 [Helianthus debilis subsp. tardiflorus]
MIVPCCGELRELKVGHYHKIIEITENVGKTLLNDYMDQKTCDMLADLQIKTGSRFWSTAEI